MKVDLGIQPFNDFWVDCLFNTQISILSTLEPSYKYAAFLNDYHHTIMETKTNNSKMINFITLASMNEIATKYLNKYFSTEPFNFKNDKYYLEKIKDKVTQRKMIAVGVDLFYWVPQSFCWGKYHWTHHSLISGFDDEKKVFYVLDDNLNGFGCFEIPEERFCKAINSLAVNPDAILVDVSKDLGPFELTLKDVLLYTKKLHQELESTHVVTMLKLDDQDIPLKVWFDLFLKYIFRVVNRQTANTLLFKTLLDLNLIRDMDFISGLIQQANDLKKGWRILEQSIVKSYCLQPNQMSSNKLHDQCNYLYHQEFKMWNMLLNYNF